MKFAYAPHSLRLLIPDHWADSAGYDSEGKLLEQKDIFAYWSAILAYGHEDIDAHLANDPLATFIRENCCAAVRLKAMAITAYEGVSSTFGYHHWVSNGSSLYLALTAVISSVDALACIMWGLIFRRPEYDRDIPGLSKLRGQLNKKMPSHPIARRVSDLYDAPWLKDLRDARDCLVHRGFWPVWKEDEGVGLRQDHGLFRKPGGAAATAAPTIQVVDLRSQMASYVTELETWERDSAPDLADAASIALLNPGVLIQNVVHTWPGLLDHFIDGAIRQGFDSAASYVESHDRMWKRNPPSSRGTPRSNITML